MPDVASLTAGSLFAEEFEIERPLADGGMGRVFVALQRSTGQRRALKVIRPELVGNESLRQRFVQEAKIGARIASDHVVSVVAAGVDKATGAPWMAMELLEGETLSAAIERGTLDIVSVREIFAQLCHAVGAAHDASVVHRDLKPDNVFLARTRREGSNRMVKLLDLGIAKLVADARPGNTETIGTPLWMAPEQSEAGEEVTPATDVWALGLIAFAMLTGRSYWKAAHTERPSHAALLREIVIEPIGPASERAKSIGRGDRIPKGFDAWFARCVARDPHARFDHARAARDALAPILAGAKLPEPKADLALASTVKSEPLPNDSTTARLSTAAEARPVRVDERARIRRRGLAVGALIGVAMIAGLAVWRSKQRADRATVPASSNASPSSFSNASASSFSNASPSSSTIASNAPVIHEPSEEKAYTETPIELRWTPSAAGHAHEIEIMRVGDTGSSKTGQFPAEVSYALWPWSGVDALPGTYRFRVRAVTDSSWSAWRTFHFHRSSLDRVLDRKRLRVGMELTFHEPFVYVEPGKQQVTGFDVDLAQKLAESLGAAFDRVPRDWNKLFTSLEAHDVDVVISAVSITDERKTKYAFSMPYLETGQRISTLASSARHFAVGDKGFALGFQSNTTSAEAARKLFPDAKLTPYQTLDSVFAALSKKEVVAIVCDDVIARFRPEHRDGRYRSDGPLLTREGYGVMMARGDVAMQKRIDDELTKLQQSGWLGALRGRYKLADDPPK